MIDLAKGKMVSYRTTVRGAIGRQRRRLQPLTAAAPGILVQLLKGE
jgi:hypothetical protein